MACINLILFLSFIFLQLTVVVVVTEVTWKICDGEINDIELLDLTVKPDPIVAPGLASVIITIYNNQTLTNPLKATLSLKKKTFLGHIPVPCFAINSCTFDDLCALCKDCNCPIEPGNNTLTLPITITSSSWMLSGTYQAQFNFESNSKQKSCVQIYNIYITKK